MYVRHIGISYRRLIMMFRLFESIMLYLYLKHTEKSTST